MEQTEEMRPPELDGVSRDVKGQFRQLRKAYDAEKARADDLQSKYDNMVNRSMFHQDLLHQEQQAHKATKAWWGGFQTWTNGQLWEMQKHQIQASRTSSAEVAELQRQP